MVSVCNMLNSQTMLVRFIFADMLGSISLIFLEARSF